MFTSEELKFFEENGYLVAKNFFKQKKLNKIKKDAVKIFTYQLEEHGHSILTSDFEESLYKLFNLNPEVVMNCGKHIQHMFSLQKLSLNKKLIKAVKKLGLEFPNTCTRTVLFFHNKNLAKEEIYYKIPAHIDAFSMDGSSNAIVVWAPLIDVDKNLGSLEIVPGSHEKNLKIAKIENSFGVINSFEEKDFLSLEMKKGDVLFFDSYLVHRSGNNITDNIRWAVNFRYNDMAEFDFIKRGFPHPYIYKSIAGDK